MLLFTTTSFWLLLTLPVWGAVLVVAVAGPMRGLAQRLVLLLGVTAVGVATWLAGPSLYGPSSDWLGNLFIGAVRFVSLSLLLVLVVGVAVTTVGWLLRGGDARPTAGDDAAPLPAELPPGLSPGEAMARAFARRP